MDAAFFLISGQVQGVGFRAGARYRALELGLSGYAQNRKDGKVELFVQGLPQSIEAFAQWVKLGPPLARVEGVNRQRAQPREMHGFAMS